MPQRNSSPSALNRAIPLDRQQVDLVNLRLVDLAPRCLVDRRHPHQVDSELQRLQERQRLRQVDSAGPYLVEQHLPLLADLDHHLQADSLTPKQIRLDSNQRRPARPLRNNPRSSTTTKNAPER